LFRCVGKFQLLRHGCSSFKSEILSPANASALAARDADFELKAWALLVSSAPMAHLTYHPKSLPVGAAVYILATCSPGLFASDVQLPATASPYPHSPAIKSITWHWNTLRAAAPGSDLWPVTWAVDDSLYVAWGDGGGFGGTDRDGRVALGFGKI